jgi:hypothetical protein
MGEGPSKVCVRFYVSSALRGTIESPLGSYYELDILPASEGILDHMIRGYTNVVIIKEVALNVGWFNASIYSSTSATYDGTTLYVAAATYNEALYWLRQILEGNEKFLYRRDHPVPFPGAVHSDDRAEPAG